MSENFERDKEINQDRDSSKNPHQSGVVTYIEAYVDVRAQAEIEARLYDSSRLQFSYLIMLLAACVIALMGLLMNSSAVIIGAMLISPLMDPILGTALALATFNWKESIRTLCGVLISVIAVGLIVFLFLSFSPLKEPTAEIYARTQPNLFDLFVAFFAAFAGSFVLLTGKGGNSIPGVAIATALMPPLVTTFYGVSRFDWAMARGAGFLFLTNFATITFSAMLIFWMIGFRPRIRHRVVAGGLVFAQVVMFLGILGAIGTPLAQTLFVISRQAALNSRVRSAVEEVVARTDEDMSVPALNVRTLADGTVDVRATIETPRYIDTNLTLLWQQRLNSAVNENIRLRVRQVSLMTNRDNLRASVAPAMFVESVDTDAIYGYIDDQVEAIRSQLRVPAATPVPTVSIYERLLDAKSVLRESLATAGIFVIDTTIRTEETGIEFVVTLREPEAVTGAISGETMQEIETTLDAPVRVEFVIEDPEVLVGTFFFERGQVVPISEDEMCDEVSGLQAFEPTFVLRPFNDGIGPYKANIRLSILRSNAVQELLWGCGVGVESIKVQELRLMPSGTEDAEDANRRIEVWARVGRQPLE